MPRQKLKGATNTQVATDDVQVFKEGRGNETFFIGAGEAMPTGFGSEAFKTPKNAPVDGLNAGINALEIPASSTDPLFATNIDDLIAANNKMVDDQLASNIEGIEETGEKGIGGVRGKFNKGSRSGIGYDSIKDDQIQQINKDVGKAIQDAKSDAAKAKLEGNIAFENQALKKLELALKIKDQADTAALNQSKLKLDSLTTDFNIKSAIPAGETVNIGGIDYTGIASPTPNTQAVVNKETGDVTVIDLDTGEPLGTIEGIAGEAAKNLQLKEIGGKVYTFDPSTGKHVTTDIVIPKKSGGEKTITLKEATEYLGDPSLAGQPYSVLENFESHETLSIPYFKGVIEEADIWATQGEDAAFEGLTFKNNNTVVDDDGNIVQDFKQWFGLRGGKEKDALEIWKTEQRENYIESYYDELMRQAELSRRTGKTDYQIREELFK